MTVDSKKLLKFIKKNIPVSFPKQHLSHTSKMFMKQIVDTMEIAVHSFHQIPDFRYHVLKEDEFPKGKEYEYVVEDIKTELFHSKKLGKEYSFTIGSRTFTIYAVYPYKETGNTTDANKIYNILDKAIKKMYVWLFIANHFSDMHCSPHLNIYWYLTKHAKTLPNENEIIDRIHVNSAFTMACSENANEMYIFREEEWFKVFIHESFHSLGLDFASLSEKVAHNAMFSIFPVHCDLRFSEAYTESWAEIINVLFTCILEYSCDESNINMDTLSRKIENKMQDEIMFSLFQFSKILRHNKMTYSDLFKKNEYKESSNVFSYYILKTIFLFFYNDFIEWTAEHNDGTLQFKQTQSNVLSLVQFIREHCRKTEFMKTINVIESIINKLPNGPEMQTLRMSITALP